MSREPIHSGHFMTSNPHDEVDEEDEDVEVEVVDEEERNNDSRAESTIADRDEKPVTFYKFGPRKTQSIAIDVSLNKINKCLKVAYDKMTTPKWKDFKGLRLQCSQRIRLNNVIWRAYYLEFKRPKKIQKKTFCYFAVPDDDATHTKVGGSVLEGMYWKRRIKAVCAQYKRWRHYVPSKKKDVKPPRPRGRAESCGCDSERPCIPTNQSKTPPPNLGRGDFYFDEDDFFPDSILEGLDEPFWFPNAREIQSDNADTIQPGLLPLQGDVRDNIEQIKQWMVSADDNYSQPAPPLHPSKPQQQSRNTSEVTNPRSTGGYSTKDYDAASVLVDYSNQGTRHALPRASQADPSTAPAALSIPVTPALMSTPHMTQPFYSQAVYGAQQQPQNQFNHHTPAEGSPFDYTPQFLAAAVASSGASPFSPYSNMVLGGGQAAQHNTRAAWWVSTSNAAAAAHGHSINHHLQQQGLQPMKQLITDKPSSGGSPFSCDSLINFGGTEHLATTRVRAVSESIANLFQPASVSPFALPHELQLQQMQADSKNVISQHHSLRSIVDPQPAAKAWGTNAQHYLRSPAAVHQQLLPPHSQASIAMMRPTIQQPPAKIPRLDPAESIPQPLFPQISTQLMTSPTLTPGVVVNSTVPTVNDRVANGGLNMLGSVAAVAAAASTSANSAPLIKTEPLIQRKWSDSQTPSQTTTISPPLSVPPASQSASQGTKRRTLSTDANPASHPADSTVQPGDRKRMVHLKAEQNRRSALKDGFEQLMKIVPDLYSNGTKPTNAVVLAKAADRIRTLQDATSQFDGGEKELDDQIAKLQARISVLQANLPKKSRANSNKSPADQKTQIQNFFEKYTKERTKEDFRFWIMSQILENFIESFATSMTAVDTSSRTAISEQCHRWINEHLSNSELQPFCSQVLVTLITNTNLMETPETLKDDILNLGLVKKA